MKFLSSILFLTFFPIYLFAQDIKVSVHRPVIPVLMKKDINPTIRLDIKNKANSNFMIKQLNLSFDGSTDIKDIVAIGIFGSDEKGLIDTMAVKYSMNNNSSELKFSQPILSPNDSISLWVAIKLRDNTKLSNRININCIAIKTNKGAYTKNAIESSSPQRVGVALRQQNQDGVVSSRIPGLTTSNKGTLMAIFDARWDSSRDLQGDMDIAMHRSFDKGQTWQPMQIIMDMKEWGGLPQKYNGVSDASILVDENTNNIFVAGLWMYGVLDKETGEWRENLNKDSDFWTHQWHGKGSQPGTGVKETSQFLIVKSSDDGKTWSEPMNITSTTKKKEWWLYAPAPGHGITMLDGTLVFPTQGRDENGLPFSNITWSKDGGKTWTTSNPAYNDVTECMVVELSDGSLMLNMRDNRNKGNKQENGRRVCITKDLGETWIEHPTSRKALIEPTCMASIHKHKYTIGNQQKDILLFCNPSSRVRRDKITLRASFDNGMKWKKKDSILLDQYRGWGYSCITSVDEETIGILYEGSQAQMIYQEVKLNEIIKDCE